MNDKDDSQVSGLGLWQIHYEERNARGRSCLEWGRTGKLSNNAGKGLNENIWVKVFYVLLC